MSRSDGAVPVAEYEELLKRLGLPAMQPTDGEEFVDLDLSVPFELGGLSGPSFLRSTVTDTSFSRGCFSRFHAQETQFCRTQIYKTEQIASVHLVDSTFEDCDLRRTALFGGQISGVRFVRCDLLKTNFSNANLVDVVFDQCRFEHTHFSGAQLSAVQVINPHGDGPVWTDGAKSLDCSLDEIFGDIPPAR